MNAFREITFNKQPCFKCKSESLVKFYFIPEDMSCLRTWIRTPVANLFIVCFVIIILRHCCQVKL